MQTFAICSRSATLQVSREGWLLSLVPHSLDWMPTTYWSTVTITVTMISNLHSGHMPRNNMIPLNIHRALTLDTWRSWHEYIPGVFWRRKKKVYVSLMNSRFRYLFWIPYANFPDKLWWRRDGDRGENEFHSANACSSVVHVPMVRIFETSETESEKNWVIFARLTSFLGPRQQRSKSKQTHLSQVGNILELENLLVSIAKWDPTTEEEQSGASTVRKCSFA